MILYHLWKLIHPVCFVYVYVCVCVCVCVCYLSSQTDPGWYISSVPTAGALQFGRIFVWTDQLPVCVKADTSWPQPRNPTRPQNTGLDSMGRVWRWLSCFSYGIIHFIFNIQLEGETWRAEVVFIGLSIVTSIFLSFFLAWAERRGYKTAKAARNDAYRAANSLLRLAIDGRMCLCLQPPGYTQSKGQRSNHYYVIHNSRPDFMCNFYVPKIL